jgi:glyoxylase-like metal-dependent hydrolase (beta-lactamase superfamily II)/ferredoxin
MASPSLRLPANAPGDFFVDSTCIDCDTCRWLAPATFDEVGDQSRVHRQPTNDAERFAAELALVACPTGSIGTETRHDLKSATDAFPRVVEDEVHHLGFHAEASFGAASYLIVRERGNVLVDVPRWNSGLVKRIEALGGVRTLFLTHIDDVADQARFAEHFGATRVMHAGDAVAGIEHVVEGLAPVALDDELVVVPTPGHTAGSACLIHRAKFLFSGDHVAWSRSREHVYAFRTACWFDWPTQIASMERLARFDFEWILPGHGTRCRFDLARMKSEMARCVAWMRDGA